MNPSTRLLRRYWLGLYGLTFAIFTLYTATFPGFVGNPEADKPGYYYVPMLFSFITFLALIICAIALAGVALWRYARHAP